LTLNARLEKNDVNKTARYTVKTKTLGGKAKAKGLGFKAYAKTMAKAVRHKM